MTSDYLLLAAIMFGVNLLPALGPPMFSVIVILVAKYDLEVVPTVAVAAIAAAAGRLVLAEATRHFFRERLSAKRKRSIRAVQSTLTSSRTRRYASLGVFAFSPIPSEQLFVAAGLMKVNLLPLTAAFLFGRIISFTIYAYATAELNKRSSTSIIDAMTSPLGIAIELATLAALVAFLRVDWSRVLARVRPRRKKSARTPSRTATLTR